MRTLSGRAKSPPFFHYAGQSLLGVCEKFMKIGSMDAREEGGFWPSQHCYEHPSGQVLSMEISINILGYKIVNKGQSE